MVSPLKDRSRWLYRGVTKETVTLLCRDMESGVLPPPLREGTREIESESQTEKKYKR